MHCTRGFDFLGHSSSPFQSIPFQCLYTPPLQVAVNQGFLKYICIVVNGYAFMHGSKVSGHNSQWLPIRSDC